MNCLQPLRDARKLGAVVFQFPASFTPGAASIAHLQSCRERLGADVLMAVEFRALSWYSSEQLGATQSLLRELRAAQIWVVGDRNDSGTALQNVDMFFKLFTLRYSG